MSRLNGEKSRAAVARRKRNAQRVRTRELRKQFLENASKPKPVTAPKRRVEAAPPTPPPVETPPQKPKRSTPKKATQSDKQA